jgi:hypothetical protein
MKSIEGPQLVIKVMRTAIKALVYIPILAAHLNRVNFLLKKVKDLSAFIKGMQSIDRLLNFKFSWKIIILNVSGLVLFVLSAITIAEKFLIDSKVIRTVLAAIPIFGVLPFGGVLHIALFGLCGTLLFLSIEKGKKLEKTAKKIIEFKISFWEHHLDINKIQVRQIKYIEKISKLLKNLELKEKQLSDCQQVEKKLIILNDGRKLKIHKKLIEDLTQSINKEKMELTTLEKKKKQWEYLERHFEEIDTIELQSYQKTKENKWKRKLKKINKEKKSNILSIIKNNINIANHIVFVVAHVSKIGLTAMPIVALGFNVISSCISVTNYFVKKSCRKMIIAPVKKEFLLN